MTDFRINPTPVDYTLELTAIARQLERLADILDEIQSNGISVYTSPGYPINVEGDFHD